MNQKDLMRFFEKKIELSGKLSELSDEELLRATGNDQKYWRQEHARLCAAAACHELWDRLGLSIEDRIMSAGHE